MKYSHTQDYYTLLGVDSRASSEEIKKAYRHLAFMHHPDRNPHQRQEAETRFKQITEAYGVLMDPVKRKEYDLKRDFRSGHSTQQTFRTQQQRRSSSFEEILRDVLNNPEARKVFDELHKEFSQRGVRFDTNFFNNLFFGGRGVFFGGFFTFGPDARRTFHTYAHQDPSFEYRQRAQKTQQSSVSSHSAKDKVLHKIGKAVKNFALGSKHNHKKDLRYVLNLHPEKAKRGAEVNIMFEREGKIERLRVKVPAGCKQGTVLRLKNKGREGKRPGEAPGDMYLKLELGDKKYRTLG